MPRITMTRVAANARHRQYPARLHTNWEGVQDFAIFMGREFKRAVSQAVPGREQDHWVFNSGEEKVTITKEDTGWTISISPLHRMTDFLLKKKGNTTKNKTGPTREHHTVHEIGRQTGTIRILPDTGMHSEIQEVQGVQERRSTTTSKGKKGGKGR